jgi:guanylate kinase
MSNNDPLLLIVSSPSGAGKTTLTNHLRQRVGNLYFSVSHTTRGPRKNEIDGREYHFVSRPAFEALIGQGAFLEWARVHDNLYGTSKSEIERAGNARGILFDVDYQGARRIKSVRPDAVSVFILPPNLPALQQRLKARNLDSAETIERRFRAACDEIEHYEAFDYLLVNDDLDQAVDKLVGIFLAAECRWQRMAPRAEQLLDEERGYGNTSPPKSNPPKAGA